MLAPSWKRAVRTAPAALLIDMPMPTASEELKESISSIWGFAASRACLVSSLHITPEEAISLSEERSYRAPPDASSRTIGFAKESPTIETEVGFSRVTTPQRSAGSKRLGSSSIRTAPPVSQAIIAVNQPVPCISGGATSVESRSGASRTKARSAARSGRRRHQPAARESEIEVVLPPHHALGHAGGAARVEQQEVVAAARHRRRRAVAAGDRLVVGAAERLGRGAGAGLAHHQGRPQLRQIAAHALEQRREVLVDDRDLRVGVVEQVAELFGAVAVVHVDGRERRLHRGPDALHVGGMVVAVDRDLGLVGGAALDHPGRQVARAALGLGPADAARTLHQRRLVAADRRDLVEAVREVPLRHRDLLPERGRARETGCYQAGPADRIPIARLGLSRGADACGPDRRSSRPSACGLGAATRSARGTALRRRCCRISRGAGSTSAAGAASSSRWSPSADRSGSRSTSRRDFAAEAAAGGHAALVADLGRRLPFRDAAFDGASLIEVIEHVLAAESLVAELARVVRPGGWLIVSTPNVVHWTYRWRTLTGHPPKQEGYHVRFFTRRTLAQVLARGGFQPRRRASFGKQALLGKLLALTGRRGKLRYRVPPLLESLLAQHFVWLLERVDITS